MNHKGGNMKHPLTTEEHKAGPEITRVALRLGERSALHEFRDGRAMTEHTIHHRFMRARHIVLILLLSFGLCFKTTTLLAQQAKVTPLMSKDLKEFPGKEGLLIAVEYPPGASDPIHRHNAHAFVYVLEGSIVMHLKSGKEVTLTPGQTFYEGPNDVHIVGRSANKTQSAKFLVFLVKEKGAPVLLPVK
jgi:quercetin dioxygenase-like cupin family protein